MTTETKKRIAILIGFVFRIIGNSLRDIPAVLLLIGFVFLLFAPSSAWMALNQFWHDLRPLTDAEAVTVGLIISKLLKIAWVMALSVRFILSLDQLSSRLMEVK
ncbi:hypothetical protein KZ126_004962 [Salmonella enterica]|nr:hypothetical protein [Salmonella enterica]EBY3151555.1 hypothetical protein [Salmonella enterica subsp. enterica serovar Teshie]ECD6622038.1 hypothetical protein [Salmonella enterica subsp. enterica]ECF3547464.1 hypothetical protein [Salmonella enterica subsp. enterica]ECJ5185846.1 hypothetical protein [Salmonella enterica subsp. enterica]